MSKAEDFLLKALNSIEMYIDRASFQIKKKFDWIDPIAIVPYLGYGNQHKIRLKGRVLEEKGIGSPDGDDSAWVNLKNMWKRYESDEIPYVQVRAVFQGQEKVVKTNGDGYFEVDFDVTEPLPKDHIWHSLGLELLDKLVEDQREVKAVGEVLIPNETAEYGVISDVDDTILISKSTEIIKKAELTFFNNAHTRTPFEGVSAFYQALHQGSDGSCMNPVFYVSSSPWNLYGLLLHFCKVHDIPKGPFLLRDLGLSENKFVKTGHIGHKQERISRIMHTYPDMQFVLIGDSGQKDAEIYEQIAGNNPDRVAAIYIRSVTKGKRDRQVQQTAENLKTKGVDMVLCETTYEAVEHAVQKGLVKESALERVREVIQKEKNQ